MSFMLRKYAKKAFEMMRSNNYQTLNHIELKQAALLHNIELITSQHPNQVIIPVLKGNAYGHGLTKIAEILDHSVCRYIAVDGYFEAAKLRDVTHKRILVMGYILPNNIPLVDTKRCSFVVQDIAGLVAFGSLGRPVRIHVELNTGFNRLGLQPNELPKYLNTFKRYPNLKLEGVMTHLADADNDLDDSRTMHQQEAFDTGVRQILGAGFTPSLIHIAQTAGSPKITSSHANAIRLGIGTYGINPLGPKDPRVGAFANLQPVLELKSTIIKVIDLEAGDSVSYNATFTAPGPMRIGVLPLGYYEGVPRELSNCGVVTYKRGSLPIVGRVCMNHTMIDLTGSGLQVGQKVTLISSDPSQLNSVTRLWHEQGLFAYSLLTGISSSVRRIIV
jgi:alanine racemase